MLTEQEFVEIHDQNRNAVWRVAFGRVHDAHIAEDVVQETFLGFWDYRDRYDRQHDPIALLTVMAKRICHQRYVSAMTRKRGGQVAHLGYDDLVVNADDEWIVDEVLAEFVDPGETPAQHVERLEVEAEIRSALSLMSSKQLRAWWLCVVENLSQRKAAELTGTDASTVGYHLERARRIIDDHVGDGSGVAQICVSCGVRKWNGRFDSGHDTCRACRRGFASACGVEGCERPHWRNGFCNAHYQRHVRGADTNSPIREIKPKGTLCKHPGCERPHSSLGWCDMHYKRHRKGWDMDAPVRQTNPKGTVLCQHPGCDRVLYAKGWCRAHYRRHQNGTDMDAPIRERSKRRS